MTYRERRLARAERLREWADKRERNANATLNADRERYSGDVAFNTQPGHIPERARVIARTDRAFESLRKADNMARRADGIERQAAAAIYSDDADATERLRDKIANLELQRARITAYNAACRKAGKVTAEALALLDDKQRADLDSIARYASFQLGKHGEFPAYAGSNLSGNIKRLRDRLARLEA